MIVLIVPQRVQERLLEQVDIGIAWQNGASAPEPREVCIWGGGRFAVAAGAIRRDVTSGWSSPAHQMAPGGPGGEYKS